MIEGVVNGFFEAVVGLPVRGPEDRDREIEAVIDTGYSGNLALPPGLVAELELPFVIRSRSALADGTVVAFNVHGATVSGTVGHDTLTLTQWASHPCWAWI